MATSHRVNVNFSESAYETLDELARRRGKTMSEVLRDAISLEKWFEDTRDEGGRVLVERDGEAREIIPR
jgi:predicted DNA-binding protein